MRQLVVAHNIAHRDVDINIKIVLRLVVLLVKFQSAQVPASVLAQLQLHHLRDHLVLTDLQENVHHPIRVLYVIYRTFVAVVSLFLQVDRLALYIVLREAVHSFDKVIQQLLRPGANEENALEKARKLLGENKKLLDSMARLLVERETIFTEEVDMLMDGKSVEEIMAFMDENEGRLSENPFERKHMGIQRTYHPHKAASLL